MYMYHVHVICTLIKKMSCHSLVKMEGIVFLLCSIVSLLADVEIQIIMIILRSYKLQCIWL